MKNKIIKQSILLFEKKGFSQTSIQDITNSLDVTKGTFYYYFSSKEQLLMKIHLAYIEGLLEKQSEIINSTLTQSEKLDHMIYLLISDIRTNGSSGRVFLRELPHLSKGNAIKIKKKRAKFRLNIEQVVKGGITSGEFKSNLKTNIVTLGILGIINWSYQWYNPKGEISEEELTDIFSNLILNGIEIDKK